MKDRLFKVFGTHNSILQNRCNSQTVPFTQNCG